MTDFFDRLENQLRGAMHRDPRARRAGRRVRRRLPRGALAMSAALLVAVPASAAVTGIWPQREADGLVRTAPKIVIAKGDNPEFGPWEAFVSDSSHGACFGLRLLDPPGVEEGSTSEGCGVTPGEPARIGGGDGPPRTGVFGFVPSAATQVRITAEGQPSRIFPTFRHPAAVAGAFFFASLPTNDRKRLRVAPLANGKPLLGSP
jgi:hypothetical protein